MVVIDQMSLSNDVEAKLPNYGSRTRLGVILPSGNTAVEPQFEHYRPEGASCHFTRLALTGTSEEQLLAMPGNVENAAALLKDANVNLIAFHCTAVSTWAPGLEVNILRRIQSSTGLRTIATSQAIVAALRAVNARRIAMLSPYSELVAIREQQFMEHHGFEVVWNDFLELETPEQMLAVSEAQWMDAVRGSPLRDVDACLISCTQTRAMDMVSLGERTFNKPIITSNSALLWYAWHTLRVDFSHPNIGCLRSVRLDATS